jgi:hypothetical protein
MTGVPPLGAREGHASSERDELFGDRDGAGGPALAEQTFGYPSQTGAMGKHAASERAGRWRWADYGEMPGWWRMVFAVGAVAVGTGVAMWQDGWLLATAVIVAGLAVSAFCVWLWGRA